MAYLNNWRVRCWGCGDWFPASREDAMACSPNCRQVLCRARKGHKTAKQQVARVALGGQKPHRIWTCPCVDCKAQRLSCRRDTVSKAEAEGRQQ